MYQITIARLSVKKVMTYDRVTMVHKILKERCPEILKGKFITRAQISNDETRRINDLQITKLRLEKFSYVSAKGWNDIPHNIRCMEFTVHFEHKMKSLGPIK